MMSRSLALGLLAASLFGAGALAQDAAPPPPDSAPRCGGLLCDMGLFHGRVGERVAAFGPEPTCGFFSRVTGNCTEPVQQAQVAPPPEPAPEPVKVKHKKHKHVAKKAEPADAAPAAAAQ